jgi:hypothetical protein
MDTEPSFYTGLDCKCGSKKCRGKLKFDAYRNIDWIAEKYNYAGYFVRKRIDELHTKWFSSSCYLKPYGDVLGLTALENIDDNKLVAKFSDLSNINESAHYIRHSAEHPNLYLDDEGKVFAKQAIQKDTQLTLNFSV